MEKRNWRKKAGAGTLILTAAVTLLAGCNPKSAEPQSTSKPTESGKAEASQSAAATAAAKRGSITVTIYDRNNIPPEEGNWDKNRWTEWVNKNGPVDVKYVPVPRWESLQKLNTLFASNSAPDLILEYDTGYRNGWYSQKLLQPIDEMVEKYSTTYKELMQQFPQLKKLGTKDDGKLYEIGKVSPLKAGHILYIRQDWLDKLNLPMPKTADDLMAVAKAFAENDPDGNNAKDTFGLNLSGNGGGIINHMFGYGEVQWRFEGDSFIHEWERLKASVDYQKQLFDGGVADKDFLADKNGEKAKQDFLTGKLGIYLHQEINANEYDTFKQNNPNGKLAVLPLPSSPYGQFSPVISSPIQMVGVVNAAAKDTKSIMEYIDFMIKPENAMTIKYGIEGTHWKKSSEGLPAAIDPEKNKVELVYTPDLGMMTSSLLFGKIAFQTAKETETEKALGEILEAANKAYVSKERPIPTLKPEYLPVLPQDLTIAVKNVDQQIKDIWAKAVVSGKSYTADQAAKDAKAIWESAGGTKVDAFYADWYKANQANAFTLDDLYSFGEEAKKLYGDK